MILVFVCFFTFSGKQTAICLKIDKLAYYSSPQAHRALGTSSALSRQGVHLCPPPQMCSLVGLVATSMVRQHPAGVIDGQGWKGSDR